MNHALRVLREELHWLTVAQHRAIADLDNRKIPLGIAATYLTELERERTEVMEAIAELDAFAPPVLEHRGEVVLGMALGAAR